MNQGWTSSKFVATVVLVPAVPMLLLSIASLGLFYLAPGRFGEIISRLPGESIIKTTLVFAPATLFAIVVLAFLYAVERPVSAQVRAGALPEQKPIGELLRRTGQWLLGPTAMASIFSLGLWALSFVSPGRYDRLLAPLPGDSYWKPLVPFTPWVLFLLTIMLAYLAFSTGISGEAVSLRTRERKRQRSLLDTAVTILLTFALPTLLASSAALIAYRLRPERVGEIIARLPFDSLVRLILLFAPPTLLSVVILAALFLVGSRREREVEEQIDRVDESQTYQSAWRASLATGVLVIGLSLSAFLGLGAVGALLYLLFR
jgi:hypothetical protein